MCEKCDKVLGLFQIEGKPANQQVTEGQREIFHQLIHRKNKRVQILCATQYGKSLITALAAIVISCIQEELVAIVAPTNDKAKIIMRYYIEHLGDSPLFYSQLEKNTKLERLKQEESKERIILRNGGGVYSLSVQATNTKRMLEAAMGEGAQNVIQDESCLIPDDAEATIFRMIAGKKDGFYCKIGNPFYRQPPYSHFFKSWRDTRYKKIFIDYEQGMNEGRYSEVFISEAKKKPHFSILFECKFPDTDTIDKEGYIPLLTEKELDRAYIEELELFGKLKLGVDVAGGGRNYSTIVLVGTNGAKILYREKNPDTMSFVGEILERQLYYGIKYEDVFVDSVGIGKGVYDRLREAFQKEESFVNPTPVNVGEKPNDDERFTNLRAESYWNMAQWIKAGAKLEYNSAFDELLIIRYKVQSDRKIKIISKEELLKQGVDSPDIADALMLPFSRQNKFGDTGRAFVYTPKKKSSSNVYTPRHW